MIKRRNRFLSMILSIILVVALLPTDVHAENPAGHTHSFDANGGCVCGAHENCETHTGWIELTQAYIYEPGNNNLSSGNYYLTEDIAIDINIYINGNVNLCLNGNFIRNSADIGNWPENAYNTVFVISDDNTLNIFDCKDTVHYFIDSNYFEFNENEKKWMPTDGSDGYFELYEYDPSYDITGKIEGTDYIVVNGGGFTDEMGIVNLQSGSFNMYGGTVIGCHESYGQEGALFSAYGDDEHCSMSFNGVTFRENLMPYDISENDGRFNTTGLINAEYDSDIKISNCEIYRNRCKKLIIGIAEDINFNNSTPGFELNNTVIENNEIQYTYAVEMVNADLNLSGNVVIRNNTMNGEQRNLYCSSLEDDAFANKTFTISNLSSASNSIGISVAKNLTPEKEVKLSLGNADYSGAFYSDDEVCNVAANNNDLMLEHRIKQQPSRENGYKFVVNTNGCSDIDYKWYEAVVTETKLTDQNTDFIAYEDLKGTYDPVNEQWLPKDDYTYNYLFQASFERGDQITWNVNFGDTNPTSNFQIIVIESDSEAPSSAEQFTESGKYSYEINKDNDYICLGCFGDPDDPAKDTFTIINAKKIKTSADKTKPISGNTTNTLNYRETGYYICEVNMKDFLNRPIQLLSSAVEIISHRISFDTNDYCDAPQSQLVGDGENATEPTAPIASGLEFAGWYSDEEFTNLYDFDTEVTEDITLYAQWKYAEPSGVKGGINKITGVDSTMEYKLKSASSWTAITGTELTDLDEGDYEVRYKASDDVLESDAVTVTVTEPDSDPVPNPVEIFVERMYENFEDTKPETEVVKDFANKLINGTYDGATLAKEFIESDEYKNRTLEDEDFVEMLYKAFFDRNPDEEGYEFWISLLESGASREEVLAGFVNSEEFTELCNMLEISRGFMLTDGTVIEGTIKAFVEHCYNTVLGRDGEQAGLDAWMNLIATGKMSATQVITDGFFHSDEFLKRELTDEEYVNLLYNALLLRNPEPEGCDFWLKYLKDGATRDDVLAGFANSVEFEGIMDVLGI